VETSQFSLGSDSSKPFQQQRNEDMKYNNNSLTTPASLNLQAAALFNFVDSKKLLQ
jgi:hypothetical protein